MTAAGRASCRVELQLIALHVLLLALECGGSWSMPGGHCTRQGSASGGRAQLSVSGSQKWKFPVSPSGRVGGPVSSNDDRSVYVQSGGEVYALDARDGSVQWAVSVASYGTVSAPVVSPDASTVFILTEQGGMLQALSATDGARLWTYEFYTGKPFVVRGWSPAVSPDSKVVYVSTPRDFQLHAVDALNGTSVWVSNTRSPKESMLASPPTVSADGATVFVVNTFPNVADAWKGDSWLVAVDAVDGVVKWWYVPTLPAWMGPAPVVSPDGLTVYISTKSDVLFAVDAVNGSMLWDFAGIPSLSSVAVSLNSEVVYAPGRHVLHALNAADGTRLWNHTPHNFALGLDVYTTFESHLTEASVSGDGATVYVGTRGVFGHVGRNVFYDYNQVLALRASNGARKWAYPEVPGGGSINLNDQYLDSLTYIAISGDGSTLYTAEVEHFVQPVQRQWARPVYLHAIDVTACDLTPVLPKGAGAGTCAEGLKRGSYCIPECPPGYGLPTGRVTCSGGIVESTFKCSPNACDTSWVLPLNGDKGNCGGIVAHGSNCTPACDTGYYPAGNVTCSLGTVRNTFECLPLPCDARPMAALYDSPGDCVGAELESGSSCQPGCPRGSAPFGSINCTAGVIDVDFECVEGFCHVEAALPPHAALADCERILRGGRLCNIGCERGYTAGAGNLTGVTCTETGLRGAGLSLVCLEDPCEGAPLEEAVTLAAPSAFAQRGNCSGRLEGGESCAPICAPGSVGSGAIRCRAGAIESDFVCTLAPASDDTEEEEVSTTPRLRASSTTTPQEPSPRIIDFDGAPRGAVRLGASFLLCVVMSSMRHAAPGV
eukprot:TRINITY_DN18955_c0_g1_i2.p1 TRINITY_DN18955_c0_g1~~TRINITY_DN18955_c0_g1_i2.p1  ORF type:complete len:856 (-),score=172.30 TRINITY_DN18955_c0_g1_i2:22-2508(-)